MPFCDDFEILGDTAFSPKTDLRLQSNVSAREARIFALVEKVRNSASTSFLKVYPDLLELITLLRDWTPEQALLWEKLMENWRGAEFYDT